MVFIYDVIMRAYYLAIRIAALKNAKARDWVKGRENERMKNERMKELILYPSFFHSLIPSFIHSQRIWMHCSSLGEFEQGKPVLEALRKKYPDAFIVLTFFSPSGYNIRKNEPLANIVTYLPLDTAQNAKIFIDALNPTMVFFVKYDIWWHYLETLHQKKIPTYLISALYREEQWRGFSFQKMYLKRALRFFSHIFLQNKTSFEILSANGFTNLTVCGDTRVERGIANRIANKENATVENFRGNSLTIICGSTWLMDENFIEQWFKNPLYHDWKFIIAPHNISSQRVKEVSALFKEAVLYSEYSERNHASRVLIINNIGLLSSLYRYADIVYIGGGFGKSIHNTLEPAAFGAPIVFGPKYKKFLEAEYFVNNRGAFSFNDSESFNKIIANLFNKDNRDVAKQVLLNYMNANAHATEKIMELILKDL